jgi:hypothetical protein
MRRFIILGSILGLAVALTWHQPVGADTGERAPMVCSDSDEGLAKICTHIESAGTADGTQAPGTVDQDDHLSVTSWQHVAGPGRPRQSVEILGEQRFFPLSRLAMGKHPARGPPAGRV